MEPLPTTLEELDRLAQRLPDRAEYPPYPLSVSAMALAMTPGLMCSENYVGTPSRNSKRHSQKPGFKRKKKGKSR